MTPAELAAVESTLLRMRAELVAAGAVEVKAELDTPVASARDEDEAPLVEMSQAIASARNRERDARLEQIADALVRLHEQPDEFGICQVCDEPIPPRRLALLPFVQTCVPCQSEAEAGPRSPVRRKVTDYR